MARDQASQGSGAGCGMPPLDARVRLNETSPSNRSKEETSFIFKSSGTQPLQETTPDFASMTIIAMRDELKQFGTICPVLTHLGIDLPVLKHRDLVKVLTHKASQRNRERQLNVIVLTDGQHGKTDSASQGSVYTYRGSEQSGYRFNYGGRAIALSSDNMAYDTISNTPLSARLERRGPTDDSVEFYTIQVRKSMFLGGCLIPGRLYLSSRTHKSSYHGHPVKAHGNICECKRRAIANRLRRHAGFQARLYEITSAYDLLGIPSDRE